MQNAIKKANKSINKAKKPSAAITILSVEERVALTLESFADFMSAQGTLDEAQALWTMARLACREEIAAAFKQYAKGKEWASYLRDLRAGLVARKIVATAKAARTLVDNQLIALKITGNTDRAGMGGKGKGETDAGGEREGAGRPEQTGAKVVKGDLDDGKMLSLVVAYCREVEVKGEAFDKDPVEMAADILRILRAGK